MADEKKDVAAEAPKKAPAKKTADKPAAAKAAPKAAAEKKAPAKAAAATQTDLDSLAAIMEPTLAELGYAHRGAIPPARRATLLEKLAYRRYF